jgi:23S rRNA (uridine2552-2'-O)-methyltransferase
MLHWRSAGRRAHCGEQGFAVAAVVSEHADLDQLVRRQRAVDLAEHARGETLAAHENDGVQAVRAALQGLPLRRRQWFLHLGLKFAATPRLYDAMARSKSSRAWLERHVNDPFVQRAEAAGYRSRAVYKLIEIDAKDRLFARGQLVIDLGAAPGGWSQVAARKVAPGGRVIAIDLLEMAPIDGVSFIRGDFTAEAGQARLAHEIGAAPVDVVLSDMSPNLSGVAATDQARAAALGELAVDFALEHLGPGGVLLMKAFQGSGFPPLLARMRREFTRVVSRKPAASRSASSEMYLVAWRR